MFLLSFLFPQLPPKIVFFCFAKTFWLIHQKLFEISMSPITVLIDEIEKSRFSLLKKYLQRQSY